MKKLLLFVLLMLPVAAFAGNTIDKDDLDGFNRLTAIQKADIVKQIAVSTEQNANSGVISLVDQASGVDATDVEEWVLLGERMGMMLGGAAKELGIAANEFATTPLGMMTMGLIIWNYAGDDLVGIALGLLWYLILIPLWTLFFFKINYKVEQYVDVTVSRWGKTTTVSKAIRHITRRDGINGAFIISGLLIVGIGLIFIA